MMQERSNKGLLARELKGTFRLDGSGPRRMGSSYECQAQSEEGVSTTETQRRSHVFVASDGARAMEGLRSDAGPIEQVNVHRQQGGAEREGPAGKVVRPPRRWRGHGE